MLPKERPIGLALLVCDSIIQDKATNKRTLVGLFDRLVSPRLPFVHPHLSVYVSITSGRGLYDCEIRCRHQETATGVFGIKGQITCESPLQEVQVVFNLASIRFAHAGIHWLEFAVDEVPLMMRRLFIEQSAPAQQTPPTADDPEDV